ncbi:hypothetical protein [Campylobacter sp. US33a]|uniref:Flagellar biosynthesis protein n=1 Tax=Campylobacter sp. CCS1377 TaxID=3158229 RepID=A0AAU7E7D7_9BACT|nr:hypothetical protein [Campylobacter sp. US33a]MCW1360503.1 hypothetical protein [Campylobacter jejuni]TEY03555.1 hypothetical protein ELQ16_03130 [Campylobacter sp. US33a]
MEFMYWTMIIIFLLIVFLITNRYEKKLQIFSKNIEILKNEVQELKNTVEKNRMLIEKNRSNIEVISQQQDKIS